MSRQQPTDGGLRRYLDGQFARDKDVLREFIARSPLFDLSLNRGISIDAYRDLTLQRAKTLLSLPTIKDQFDVMTSQAPGCLVRGFALGEVFAMTDLSVNVKMGVMTWLFGGAVICLGSDAHRERWFNPIRDLSFTGMFCMTEIGHGSNVRQIETEARFDHATQEFVIHTPCDSARKCYIGNALMGEYAIVFAQLIVGGESKGPHAFVVPIRDKTGLFRGIRVEDLGEKEGLNGVDNGVLSFTHVRIPRENLLNRFADVRPDGSYVTSIPGATKRFNAMLAALVGTRVALSAASVSAAKVGLAIAIRYAHRRKQFGPSAAAEQTIMNYQSHQLRLMPPLATSLALTFLVRHAGTLLEACVLAEDEGNREVQALCAGLKAYASWRTISTLQTCRECCGGQGFMTINRLAQIKCDSDIFVTFEGDNVVLMQQVAKDLLAQYARQFEGGAIAGLVKFVRGGMSMAMAGSALAGGRGTVGTYEFAASAMRYREERLLQTLAARLFNSVKRRGDEPFGAWNSCLDHIMALSSTHVERRALEHLHEAAEACPDAAAKSALRLACDVFGLHVVHAERGWFLEQNYMTRAESRQLRGLLIRACGALSQRSLEIVDAFGIPDSCLAPISGAPTDCTWARM
eukprot:Opistho-1_new@79819